MSKFLRIGHDRLINLDKVVEIKPLPVAGIPYIEFSLEDGTELEVEFTEDLNTQFLQLTGFFLRPKAPTK